VRKAGQQVLILSGTDRDSHGLDPALPRLVGRVVLNESVQAVMSDPELDVLSHSSRCQRVQIIGISIINPEAHRMDPFPPWVDSG
jgi:hypothetical protein